MPEDHAVMPYPQHVPLLLAAQKALRQIRAAEDYLVDDAGDAIGLAATCLRVAAMDLERAIAANEPRATEQQRLHDLLLAALAPHVGFADIRAAQRVLKLLAAGLGKPRRRQAGTVESRGAI